LAAQEKEGGLSDYERKQQEDIANDMSNMMATFKDGVKNIADDMAADAKVSRPIIRTHHAFM
jgi:hypothetical protein